MIDAFAEVARRRPVGPAPLRRARLGLSDDAGRRLAIGEYIRDRLAGRGRGPGRVARAAARRLAAGPPPEGGGGRGRLAVRQLPGHRPGGDGGGLPAGRAPGRRHPRDRRSTAVNGLLYGRATRATWPRSSVLALEDRDLAARLGPPGRRWTASGGTTRRPWPARSPTSSAGSIEAIGPSGRGGRRDEPPGHALAVPLAAGRRGDLRHPAAQEGGGHLVRRRLAGPAQRSAATCPGLPDYTKMSATVAGRAALRR